MVLQVWFIIFLQGSNVFKIVCYFIKIVNGYLGMRNSDLFFFFDFSIMLNLVEFVF